MNGRRARLLRFILVGSLNTFVDFAILFLLTWAGMAVVFANVISTSVGLAVSFTLNRNFTFRSDGHRGRQLTLFLVVTLFGLWVLQPVVIMAVDAVVPFAPALTLLVGKLAATVVSMVWNYLLYDLVVFRGPRKTGEAQAD